MPSKKKHKEGRGGARVAGPGKEMGRPRKSVAKKKEILIARVLGVALAKIKGDAAAAGVSVPAYITMQLTPEYYDPADY